MDVSSGIRWLTGARTRIVWNAQVAGDWTDSLGTNGQMTLMGLDTDDGQGARVILGDVGSYRKPLFTHDGNRIVFTDYSAYMVKVVNWDGTGVRDLVSGVATEVWRDPATGIEWAYVITGRVNANHQLNGGPLVRVQLDKPAIQGTVWDSTEVSGDGFQLSRDGHFAAGQFPWKAAGFADMRKQTWSRKGNGCWTSMAPDNSYVFWAFRGDHRTVQLYSPERRFGWKVQINKAQGIDGAEVYHPRWSNHSRYICMTGPYKNGEGPNQIRSGGKAVEIYVGHFNSTMTEVEHWVQVTSNDVPDYFPDVWVSGESSSIAGNVGSGGMFAPSSAQARAGRVVIRAKLVDATPIPTRRQLGSYRSAMIMNTYEIVELKSGTFKGKRLNVAQWVVKDRKILPIKWRRGKESDLVVEKFNDHPELEGERLLIKVGDDSLPKYCEVRR